MTRQTERQHLRRVAGSRFPALPRDRRHIVCPLMDLDSTDMKPRMVQQQSPHEICLRKARETLAMQIEELHLATCPTRGSIVGLRLLIALRADLPLDFYQDKQKVELILGPLALECKMLTRRLLTLCINNLTSPAHRSGAAII